MPGRVLSIEGLGGGTNAENVVSNDFEDFVELVTPMTNCARDCPWQSCAVKRKVSKRNNIVITAMVEEYFRDLHKLLDDVGWQLQVIEIPTVTVP